MSSIGLVDCMCWQVELDVLNRKPVCVLVIGKPVWKHMNWIAVKCELFCKSPQIVYSGTSVPTRY